MDLDVHRQTGSGESDFNDSLLAELIRPSEPLLLPRPGERLGGPQGERFEILEHLGQGGMGQVFRAWDSVLRRPVALKFLLPRGGLPGGALAWLLEEARAIAQLAHENIVRIFDVSQWRATPFLIMEYLEGQNLEAVLRRGRMELKQALAVLRAVAEGLAHAHANQVIHRDLKPSNVFLLGGGAGQAARLRPGVACRCPTLGQAGAGPGRLAALHGARAVEGRAAG